MSAEKINAPKLVEAEHFDDFGAMDIALRGLTRVLADRAKADAALSRACEDWSVMWSYEKDDDDKDDGYEDGDNWANEEGEDENYEDDYDYENDEELRTEELEREKQFEVLTIPREILEEYKIPEGLPAGVAVMGGTARSLARRVVTGDKEPVRDLDLVYIEEFSELDKPIDQETLDEISEKYMPDDFAYGHGIKRENLEHYFGSRDFTMNQCLVVGDKLLMTRAAYDDFQENIIRPSYDRKPRENSSLRDGDFMRGLLFLTILRDCTSSYPVIEDLDEANYAAYYDEMYDGELYPMGDFQVALTLNKAMSRGVRTAMHFTETLVDYNIVDKEYIDQPLKLARDIMKKGEIYFQFRPVDGEIDEGNKEDFDIQSTAPMKESVRGALREYQSRENKKWSEPMSGQYTEADYDRANLIA